MTPPRASWRARWGGMWMVLSGTMLTSLMLTCACLRSTSFACQDDNACGAGRCETGVGFCSFVDGTCASGRRFGDLSGPLANQCVGDGDGGVPGDAMTDGPMGCPATGYASLGGSAHKYKLRTSASWTTHRNACASEGAFLAIPDDAGELSAILGLSGAVTWIGVHDEAQEGTYVTALGAPATFLPWSTGEPNNDPGNADCVRALTTMLYADDRCTTSYVAVCECVP